MRARRRCGSITGLADQTTYRTILDGIVYNNADQDPDTAARDITVVVNDGVLNSNIAHTTISVTAVNDAPVTDLNGATGGDDATATFTEDGGAVLIGAAAATITDVDDTNMESMTITLTNRPDGNGLESLNARTWFPAMTLIVGSPGETEDDTRATLDLSPEVERRGLFAFFVPSIFTPLHDTRLEHATGVTETR